MTPTPSSPSHHWTIEKYLTVPTFQLPLHSYLSVALSPPIVLLSPLSQGTPQRCRPVLVSGHFTIQNLGNGLGFKKHVYSSGEDHLLISDHHFKPPGQRWSPPLISSLYHSWSARTSRWSLSTTRLLSARHLDHPDCRGARVPACLSLPCRCLYNMEPLNKWKKVLAN